MSYTKDYNIKNVFSEDVKNDNLRIAVGTVSGIRQFKPMQLLGFRV